MMVNEHRLQLSQQHGFTKEAMRKNSFKYDPLCPTIQSIPLYYQKFHEASFPPNHCCLCKLHVWKIKILYESTNMQPFHVLFVNRTTTICSTETKPKIEPFWEALCSPSLDDGEHRAPRVLNKRRVVLKELLYSKKSRSKRRLV